MISGVPLEILFMVSVFLIWFIFFKRWGGSSS